MEMEIDIMFPPTIYFSGSILLSSVVFGHIVVKNQNVPTAKCQILQSGISYTIFAAQRPASDVYAYFLAARAAQQRQGENTASVDVFVRATYIEFDGNAYPLVEKFTWFASAKVRQYAVKALSDSMIIPKGDDFHFCQEPFFSIPALYNPIK